MSHVQLLAKQPSTVQHIENEPNDHRSLAIFSCVLCNSIIGILAIIYSSKVSLSLYNHMDAKESARTSLYSIKNVHYHNVIPSFALREDKDES